MNSIRRVMLVALLGLMSLVMLGAGAFSYYAGLQEAGEMFDAKLAHSSRVLMSLVDEPLGDLAEHDDGKPMLVKVWHGDAKGVGSDLVFPSGHAYETKLAFQVRDSEGKLLLRSDSGPEQALASLSPGFADVVIDGQAWRTFTLRSPTGHWYQSGELSDIRSELAEDLAEGTLVPMLIALPLLALLIWLVVNWATRSLLRASREIEERDPSHLTPIRVDRVPREIQGIVKSVNGLLQRLSDTLARERRFTADAAHELRTPVAALKVHAHNLRAARSSDERNDSQQQLDASVHRVERLVDQLLTLSRVEPGTPTMVPVALDLHELAGQQLSYHHDLAAARNIALELDADRVVIDADRNAIDALLRNLIDNAIRYTPPGGRVRLVVRREGFHAVLQIEDSGPGVPPQSREKVFERFHRELGNDVEGSGLGLSIVAQVLQSHGGSIQLDQSAELGGLKATVILQAR